MLHNKYTLFFLIIIFLVGGCRKTGPSFPEPTPPLLSTEKELLEFNILQELNKDYINETIEGVVSDSDIVLNVPKVADVQNLIASFEFEGESIRINNVPQTSGETENDFSEPLVYTVFAEDGSSRDYPVKIISESELKSEVPHIYINTENQSAISSKTNYVSAEIIIDGKGVFDDYTGQTGIRGRGNSTWSYPKKPFKLKLDSKAPLLGLASAKKWILLANYLDESLMSNAVAMKTGQLLRMPFTNHIIPVDVTINGEYKGNYMFTEHKEVKENRINIGENGVLLEMDSYFDQAPWQFKSHAYNLPVMIQYPKLEDMSSAEATPIFDQIKEDFETFEAKLADPAFPENDYLDYLDVPSFVNYMIVYMLTDNRELNHPKSTYLHKLEGDNKYRMGFIWDFDWAFGYEGEAEHFIRYDVPIIGDTPLPGTNFFGRVLQSPEVRAQLKTRWSDFKSRKYPKLLDYIDEYAAIIKESMAQDYDVWHKGSGDSEVEKQRMLDWLDNRIVYLDGFIGAL